MRVLLANQNRGNILNIHLRFWRSNVFFFKCNYNVKDLQITSTFYLELLKWWSELREDNALNNDWHYVICFRPYSIFFHGQ